MGRNSLSEPGLRVGPLCLQHLHKVSMGMNDLLQDASIPRTGSPEPRILRSADAELEEGWCQIKPKGKRQYTPAAATINPDPLSAEARSVANDPHEHEYSDSDEDDEEADQQTEVVQLGFAEPISSKKKLILFDNPNWHEWDGGKIGGKPVWLNTEILPTREGLECPSCHFSLCFLLQIYCPLETPGDAFHRVIYIFCCRRATCVSQGTAKAFRCQLARQNPFYAYQAPKNRSQQQASSEARQQLAVRTCDLCGQIADKCCGGCSTAWYCSKAHQKEDWIIGHKSQCQAQQVQFRQTDSESKQGSKAIPEDVADVEGHASESQPPTMQRKSGGETKEYADLGTTLLPEFEIVVEEERGSGSEDRQKRRREEETLLLKYKHVFSNDIDDEDAKVGQRDLNRAVGARAVIRDKHTSRFLLVTGREPDQILRYSRWQDTAVLWVTGQDRPGANDIPACPRCKAPRAFEFQVLPQLLHYLRVDAQAHFPSKSGEAFRLAAMDWGTLAVYTCAQSCSGAGYSEEVVWRQRPLE